MAIKLDERKTPAGSTPQPWPFFCDSNSNTRSFAVANLLIQTAKTSGNVIQRQDDARHEMLQTAHLMPDGHPLCKELNIVRYVSGWPFVHA